MTAARSALLVGATGLVGGECLKRLAADPWFGRVVALARRPVGSPADGAGAGAGGRVESRVVDFERLADAASHMAVDQVFCALGTTIRRAGSRSAFRRVDLEYPLEIARLALDRGARHFLLVSSVGADAGSRFFYTRVKGEVEDALRALPYRSLTIARPSLLLGERRERRPGEAVAKRLGWLAPRRWRPVTASAVAASLVAAAKEDRPGVRVIESAEMGE